MVKLIEKYPIATICTVVLVMLLPNLDVLNVSIMEARNFITAREMVHDGNWLLTTMNGAPRYQKPPLPTWITAVFGMFSNMKSLFALRFPTVLMILLIGVYTYFFSHKLTRNNKHSLANGLIVVTSFYVIGITIEAPWDIYTHAFMLMGIYYLFYAFENQTSQKTLFLATVFMGLSFLSKGPISFYALLLPFILAYAFSFKLSKQHLGYLLLTIIVSVLLGGWWFVYVRLADPEAFLEIAKKETGNWSSYNVRPFYYYWSFFTQSGIWTIPAFISLLYPYFKKRVANVKAYKLSFLWTVFSVVLLSIVPEKKSRYLMPVLIPLAFNIGFYINYLFKHFKNFTDRKDTYPVYFNFGLIGLIGLAFPVLAYSILKDHLSGIWFEYSLASIVLFLIGLFLIIQLVKKHFSAVFYLTIALFVAILITGLPLSKVLVNNDSFQSISKLHEQSSVPIYSFKYYSPEIIWDFGRKIPNVEDQGHLQDSFGLLTNEPKKDIEKAFNGYVVTRQTSYNINRTKKGNRGYKDRLTADYYVLTKR